MFDDELTGRGGERAAPRSGPALPAGGAHPSSPGTTADRTLAGAESAGTRAEGGECCELQARGGVCDHMIAALERALAEDRMVLAAEEAVLASLSPGELAALAAVGYPSAVNHLDAETYGEDDASGSDAWDPRVQDGWVERVSGVRQGLSMPVDVLAALDPGPELAAEINDVDLTALDDYALVEVLAAARRVESWAAGVTARAAAQLSRAEVFDPARFGSRDPEAAAVPEEVAMRLGVSKAEAKKIITVGQGMTGSFTATGQALSTGQIDWQKAATIVTTLRSRPDAVAWFAEQEVLERAGRRNVSQLTRDLAKAIIAVDAEDAAAAHKRVNRSRHVTHPRPLPDGMASMYVVGAAQDLVGVDLVLDAAATAAKACGDARTKDQLRADALFTLTSGALETGWVGAPPTWVTRSTDDAPPSRAPASREVCSRDPGAGEVCSRGHGAGEVCSRGHGAGDARSQGPGVRGTRPADQPGAPGTVEGPAGAQAPIGPDPVTTPESQAPDPDGERASMTTATADTGTSPPGLDGMGRGAPSVEGSGLDDSCDGIRCAHDVCGCAGTAADLGVLPELLRRLRRRPGMRLGDARTNRTEVRLVVPLSVVQPPRPGATGPAGEPAAGGEPPAAEDCWDEPEPSEVAELIGYGPITPDVARAIAAGGTWRRIVTDPLSGAVLDVGRRRYRPPAELAAFVRERDKTCIRPGCSTPATRCQLDHTIPASRGGTTSAGNLGPACERDHGIKTNGQAKVTQPRPGVFEWVTPTGHAYRRDIDGTTALLPRGYAFSGSGIPF